MTVNAFANLLLELPAFPAHRTAELADRVAAVLQTNNDVLIVQGEAIIALEAAALSLARPGIRALNIITSPYGALFGTWLQRGGAEVVNLRAEPAYPIAADRVEQALLEARYDIVSLVHAESASGILNPLPQIAAVAKAHGALVVVDAVASVGGHLVDVDDLGIDIAVTGPQKSLGGSAGLSFVSVSPAAWGRISAPGALEKSTLSLLDLKTNWLDIGRGALPGMPSALELHALDAALTSIETEGLATRIARHQRAADATRAGLKALGLSPLVHSEQASNLATAAVLPVGASRTEVLAALAPHRREIGPAVGPGTDNMLRLNHTGPRARYDIVLGDVTALGIVLAGLGHVVDIGAAALAIAREYDMAGA